MKRFTKTLLSVAAVSAVSAAMAVSAMAMTATYDATAGTVTLEGITSTGASQTLLILNENADVVEQGHIVQIDQKDNNEDFNLVAIPVGELTAGAKYYVRVGGTDCSELQRVTLEVPSAEVKTETITVGDADLKNGITTTDATYVAKYAAGVRSRVGKTGTVRNKADGTEVIVGDADLKNGITTTDATYVAKYAAGVRSRVGKTGTSVDVVVVTQ